MMIKEVVKSLKPWMKIAGGAGAAVTVAGMVTNNAFTGVEKYTGWAVVAAGGFLALTGVVELLYGRDA